MDMVLDANVRNRRDEGTLVERVKRYILTGGNSTGSSVVIRYDGGSISHKVAR